jgi:hypothetical protein
MSDDLVERLRALARHQHDDLDIGFEAADEIERLRAGRDAALEEAANFLKARAYKWHREADLQVHVQFSPSNVPAGWMRFKVKATEASECAELVRAMKETEG